MSDNATLTGYSRSNGRWGFRNYLLLLPLHNALNQLVDQVRTDFGGDKSAGKSITAVAHDWSGEIDQTGSEFIAPSPALP